MYLEKGSRQITSLNDWLAYAHPTRGEYHLKPSRSALELATSWLGSGVLNMPNELKSLLKMNSTTFDFQPRYGIPELETKLDCYRGKGRTHDLIIVGESTGLETLISIEAKADEIFGQIISKYIASTKFSSNVPNRIRELSQAIFGNKDTSMLRYQLLHAVAGTLIEAKARGALKAILIIHEFVPKEGKTKKAKQNEKDLMIFVELLAEGTHSLSNGQLVGPIVVPGGEKVPSHIPLYIGKIETKITLELEKEE